MKLRILFVLIIILSIALRFFQIGRVPNGIYSDEIVYAYNAYSMLTTGSDEYGVPFPLAFKSFGDYKTPLYIYFFVPFIAAFGMNDVSTRMPSAVLGVGSVWLMYQLARAWGLGNETALLSAFFMAVLPFGLQFHRMAHENTLVLVLVMAGLYFFFRSFTRPTRLMVSAVAFSLSIYTYHDARVFIPLFLLLIIILYRHHLYKHLKVTIVSAGLFMLILIPLATIITGEEVWSRPGKTIILSDQGTISAIESFRSEDQSVGGTAGRVFHNKIVDFSLKFFENYLAHFSPEFLFFSGDTVKIYHTIGSGVMLLVVVPVMLLGFAVTITRRVPHASLLTGWLLAAPVAASLTRFVPSASRTLLLLPVFCLFIAVGLVVLSGYLQRTLRKKSVLLLFTVGFVVNFAYYLHMYYVHTPLAYAKEWHYGMGEVLAYVRQEQNRYNHIWFSKNAWGYLYPLYYLQYPPEQYQPQALLGPLNEYGFGWVDRFDRYVFADIPARYSWSAETLYIGIPSDFPSDVLAEKTVYYPNGEIAFIIVDGQTAGRPL